MIRFDFPELSPGMAFVLSWLIDRGGAMSYTGLLASIKPAAKAEGRFVTRSTVNGLLNRGYLEEPFTPPSRVQVGAWAVHMAARSESNPPVPPIMRARTETLAHQESAARTATMINRTWANRNTEGNR